MDKEKYFQCVLLNSIYYQGRLSTEMCGGGENMLLCFSRYLKSCGGY